MKDLIEALSGPAFTWIAALALAIARPLAIVTIVPVFSRLGLVGMLRNGVAFALAVPLLPMSAELMATDPRAGRVLALIAKEVAVGLLLGVLFSIPFWGAETAGGYLDSQRASQGGTLTDPLGQTEDSILGALFVMVLLALFYSTGGMLVLSQGFYGSYGLWPLDAMLPPLTPATPGLVLALLDRVFWLALVLAGPLIVLMLMSDVVLAVISRFTPQINAFDLSLAIKSAVLVLVLPLYGHHLLSFLGDSLKPVGDVLDSIQAIVP
jgi:type III secretion protein T